MDTITTLEQARELFRQIIWSADAEGMADDMVIPIRPKGLDFEEKLPQLTVGMARALSEFLEPRCHALAEAHIAAILREAGLASDVKSVAKACLTAAQPAIRANALVWERTTFHGVAGWRAWSGFRFYYEITTTTGGGPFVVEQLDEGFTTLTQAMDACDTHRREAISAVVGAHVLPAEARSDEA